MATPAACQSIESNLKKKREQLNRLNNSRPSPGGPVVKPGRDRDPELEAERKRLSNEIKTLNAQLTQCMVQQNKNRPLTVRWQSLFCEDQDDTEVLFNTEDDEPYLVVYALNLPTTPNIANPASFVPDARAFKIGPFSSVDSGDTRSGAMNVWDTNGNARPITDPNSAVILVAMMEFDESGADMVRTAVQTAMPAIVVTNLAAAFTDPAAFRVRLMEGMAGIIQTAVKAAVGSQDDQIGPIKQIRLTRSILDRAYRDGSVRFDLRFTKPGARYSATFNLVLA
ncbi:MAG: hypothetical protein ACRDJE_12740 [Dehalococcoidia bacterium]